jgi:nicotinate-nucleotide adenylyltransferase
MIHRQKIGILGGTFDPIHLGHLILAEQMAGKFRLDEVIFIPSASPPHKDNKKVSSAKDRFKMTELAIENNPLFSISDIELKRKGKSYTVITVHELKKLYPQSELFLLCGSDVLDEIKTWKKPDEIYRLIKVIIGVRPGYNKIKKDNKYAKKSIIEEMNGLEVSSTEIRERVKKGKSIRYLVPAKVEEFIRAKGLYR